MMASFCFALFSFQLDKVDETIIFVIGQSSRNVMVEDFCRWRDSATVKGMEKYTEEFWGSPLLFPLSDCGLLKMDRGSQQALQALYHCGKK